MSRDKQDNLNLSLANALKATLLKRIPPHKDSPHLTDIVNILMEALYRGEIYVDIHELTTSLELKGNGWPSQHITELTKSGWAEGEKSPIIMRGNQISWRRWNN